MKVLDTPTWPRNLVCIDSSNIFIYARGSSLSYIHYSSNGGFDWEKISEVSYKESGDLSYMSCSDVNNIFLIYNLNKIKDIVILDRMGKLKFSTSLNNPQDTLMHAISSIIMKDSLYGIAQSYNGIYVTNNGWKTYNYIYVDNYYGILNDIHIHSKDDFSLCTTFGYFYRTTDGGKTFNKRYVGSSGLEKIEQINDSVIYISGGIKLSSSPSTVKTFVYKSMNYGNTWNLIFETEQLKYNYHTPGFRMIDEKNGMINIGNDLILQTKDSWNSFTIDSVLKSGREEAWATLIDYAGNRPLVVLSDKGMFTYIDTLYENMQKPILLNPENNSLVSNIEQNLTWKKVTDNDKYILQLSYDSIFSKNIILDTLLVKEQNQFPNSSIEVKSLMHCNQYYWRVASKKINTIKWSDTFTFQTLVEIPELQLPMNNTEIKEDSIEFRWQPANNALRYHLQISTDSLFESLIYSQDTIPVNYLTLTNLTFDKPLYWRLRTICSQGYGEWSVTWSFLIKDISSINESDSKINIISPNPANDFITINLQPSEGIKLEEGSLVEIYDMLGVKVISELIHPMTSSHRMNVKRLPVGLYFVKIGDRFEKFVKM